MSDPVTIEYPTVNGGHRSRHRIRQAAATRTAALPSVPDLVSNNGRFIRSQHSGVTYGHSASPAALEAIAPDR